MPDDEFEVSLACGMLASCSAYPIEDFLMLAAVGLESLYVDSIL
jgi:hypothetical protein